MSAAGDRSGPPSRSRIEAHLLGIFRIALRAFPPEFRVRWGAEMEEAFIEGVRRARQGSGGAGPGSRMAPTAHALRALANVVTSGIGWRLGVGTCGRETSARGAGSAGALRLPAGAGDPPGGTGWIRSSARPFAGLGGDLRVALRSLGRAPAFTLGAAAVLALGIGANITVFQALRAVYLAPLPFPEADRLVLLDLTFASSARPGPPEPFPWSYPKFGLLAEWEGRSADPVAAYASRSVVLTGAGEPASLQVELVTPDYLEVLGVTPLRGRDFLPEDDEPVAEPSVLLGHGLWTSRFGGDPGVVGRTITLNGTTVTVLGVLPEGFRGLTGAASAWIPVHTGAVLFNRFLVEGASAHWMQGVGRLRPGVSLETLDAEMARVGDAAAAAWPDFDPTARYGGSARALASVRAHPTATASLRVLSLAAGLLLLVACANLAGLFLARGAGRQGEVAVRTAMGAGRWRVARGVIVETGVLAVLGGAAGSILAWLAVGGLSALWPSRLLSGSWNVQLVDPANLRPDPSLLAGAMGLALAVGALAALAPAWQALRQDPGTTLRHGGRGTVGGSRRRRELGSALVTAEVALALVLVVGAGLMLRSMGELAAVPRGIETANLLVVRLAEIQGSAEERLAFRSQVLQEFGAVPGVVGVTVGCAVPLSGRCSTTRASRAGEREWPEGSRPSVGVQTVEDGYFGTLGIPLLAGRSFGPDDVPDGTSAAILSQEAARTLFPGEDPLGRTFAMGYDIATEENGGAIVVGVVGDVLYGRPEEGVMPDVYLSLRQVAGGSAYLVRTAGPLLAVAPALQGVTARLRPDLPPGNMRTFADIESSVVAETRVVWILLASFGGLALLLAAAGVWGVVAFGVSRRTRELGLRMALGARSGEVVGLVIRQGMVGVVVGVVVGAAAALAAGRVLRAILFEVGPGDPAALAGGAAVLLCVALLAAWLPARRATRVDPVRALQGGGE